jgi:hypothetical protein
VVRSQSPGQLAQRFLMFLVRDLGEVSCEFQTHSFARTDRSATLLVETLEKVAYRHAEDAGNFEQAAGRDPVYATFVFVGLLVGYPDEVGQLLLGEAEHDPALPNPGTDMAVDILGTAGGSLHNGQAFKIALKVATYGVKSKHKGISTHFAS